MVYGNFAQYNMITKHKRTVLSGKDKIIICEYLEITREYKITAFI